MTEVRGGEVGIATELEKPAAAVVAVPEIPAKGTME
jgi:hypothetical protein